LLKYDLEHLDAFMPDFAIADLATDLIENTTASTVGAKKMWACGQS